MYMPRENHVDLLRVIRQTLAIIPKRSLDLFSKHTLNGVLPTMNIINTNLYTSNNIITNSVAKIDDQKLIKDMKSIDNAYDFMSKCQTHTKVTSKLIFCNI